MTRCLLAAALSCVLSLAARAAEPSASEAGARAAPSGEEKAESRRSVEPELLMTARAFHQALLAGSVEALASLCRTPFFFEGKSAGSAEEVRRRWAEALQGRVLPETKLYDLEFLTFEEMISRYGKPPEKLAAWPLKGGMLSVANLDGHAVVVLWKKSGQSWQALGFHD